MFGGVVRFCRSFTLISFDMLCKVLKLYFKNLNKRASGKEHIVILVYWEIDMKEYCFGKNNYIWTTCKYNQEEFKMKNQELRRWDKLWWEVPNNVTGTFPQEH